MSEIKLKIGDEIEAVKSDIQLSDPQRESTLDLLRSCETVTNGSLDRILDLSNAFGLLAIYIVRRDRNQAVETATAISRAINSHANSCVLASAPKGKLGLMYQFRNQLTCILALALISPYGAPILRDVVHHFLPTPTVTITH